MRSMTAAAVAALSVLSTALAPPPPPSLGSGGADNPFYPVVASWIHRNGQGRFPAPACNNETVSIRKDFDTMQPAERKAYTDAINCLRDQPSQLNQTQYPAAINRFFDYAVIHVNKTRVVHLDGFFLTWHRMFLYVFEQDLRHTCGYRGAFPYWNWPATADNLTGSNIFNGDDYSMSGDGAPVDLGTPIVLAPGLAIPHGSGGGCIMSGPFKGMNRTMDTIPIQYLINGTAPPASAYERREKCLTRDLNIFAAKTWCNSTVVQQVVETTTPQDFEEQLNGVIGGHTLGIHSGAHFVLGDPAANIFVSAQDPIWYPLHTMLDRVYVSWQARHPELANSTHGTMTATNAPPSANVTLNSTLPDWGYLNPMAYSIGDLISTTAGPFCYRYDSLI